MSRLVQAETERFRGRMPDARQAQLADPVHNHQTRWLDRLLCLVDVVMEDEGVPVEVRRRVVRGVLYGSPNPVDAEERIELRDQLVEAARNARPTAAVVEELLRLQKLGRQ